MLKLSVSRFKYPVYRISEGNAEFRQYYDFFNCDTCYCKCDSGIAYLDFTYAYDIPFFRGLRLEHYQELNNNVFVWLSGLDLVKDESDVNARNTLFKLVFDVQQDSLSYDDARKHMPKKMKKNIDNYKKYIQEFNSHIDIINQKLAVRIQDIINRPVFGGLPQEKTNWIYDIVRIGYSQTLLDKENVDIAIKNWNLADKVRSRDFVDDEINNVRNILGAIAGDDVILQWLQETQDKIKYLTKIKDNIVNQAKEISIRIEIKRYRGVRRCCPNLIKELWHTIV